MRTFLSLLALLWAASLLSAQTIVQIGVIAVEEQARGPADLLTAGLSTRTNIILVERNELDKAMRERGLVRGQRANLTDLGKQLHADGLVLLETAGTSGATKLAVRLVAVNSGVVLDAAVYPLPLPEPARWTEVASARLARLQPKLRVPRDRAVPISILNLHAAVATPDAAETERALGTLLFHRLAREPEIFVLERRQLGRAEWEKTLAMDEKAFWTGGYLLEGLVDREGTSRETITVNAQLFPPANGKPVAIDISGPRRNLPEVADQLARRILTGLRSDSKGSSWDRTAEAERFEQECSWAMRWHMCPEAYSAAEAAWHLGRHTETVATVRLKSLVEQTKPDSVWNYDALHQVYNANRARGYDPVRNVFWTTNPPPENDLAFAIEAAGAYTAISRSPETSWKTSSAWGDLGTNVLATASAVIRHQYSYGWRSNEFHQDLPLLRQTTRELASALPEDRARALLLREGAFWQESPGAVVQLYRQALQSRDLDDKLIFSRDVFEPFWVGWTPADREKGRGEWNAFIAELQVSSNRVARARGALLKLHQARFDPEVALAHEEFLDSVMDEQHRRFSTEVDFTVLDVFSQVLSNKCARPVTLRRTRLQNAWKSCDFARVKHYLQTARVHNVDRAGWPLAERVFTQAQARELLPVVNDYIRRIGGDWMQRVREHVTAIASKPTDEFDAFFAEPVFDAERFRRVFVEHKFTADEARRLATPLRAYASRLRWPEDLREVDARLQALLTQGSPAATNTPPVSTASVLKVTRRLQPMFKDYRGELLPARVDKSVEYDGKFITVGTHPSTGAMWPPPADGPHVIELDPITGESRMLPQVLTAERYQPIKFQVIANQVFWIAGQTQIGVLERRSSGLHLYTVGLPLLQSDLVALDRRLFIASSDYLAEFSTSDHSVKLLASKRRKPAANRLDGWPGWSDVPKIWLHENSTLFASMGRTNVWTYDAAKSDWNEWRSSQDRSGFPWRLSFDSTSASCFDERIWIDGARQTLLSARRSRLPFWSMPFDYPLTPGRTGANTAVHCFDGTNLWVLVSPAMAQIASNTISSIRLKDRHFTLLWFDPRFEIPKSIPIWLEGVNSNSIPPGFKCAHVSRGLVFEPSVDIFSGRWFLPWTELVAWVSEHQPDARNLPRSEPERRKFDLNGDGILGPDELKAMESDREWTQREEQLQSRRLLLTFDANRDDKLDAEELKRFASLENEDNFLAEVPSHQSSIIPGRLHPEELLRSCDQNKDSLLAGEEILNLYRRLSTPVPASSRFGFHPVASGYKEPLSATSSNLLARFDRNHNGKLDPDERNRIREERLRVFDRNKNGVLDADEMQAYSQSLKNESSPAPAK